MYRLQKVIYGIAGILFLFLLFPVFIEGKKMLMQEEKWSVMDIFPLYRYMKSETETGYEDEDTAEEILRENEKYVSVTEAPEEKEEEAVQTAALVPHPVLDLSRDALSNYEYLVNNFFIIDSATTTDADQLNLENLMEPDLSLVKDNSVPQILIYHSHSQEGFADSDLSDPEQRIVGVGSYLTEILEKKYGYQVMHVKEEFDVINGVVDRSAAYDMSEAYVEQVLEENPSIEVVIDLHRDGIPEDQHLVTEINGKPTAKIMGFNGLSYSALNGPVEYLPNPYINENLAFSFQLIYQADCYYPELYRGIYLASLRYNLQLKPRAILLEAGSQTNTLQEVKNAMEPFAEILNQVLSGKSRDNCESLVSGF